MTPKELYELIHAEYDGWGSMDLDAQGAQWVMNLASYKEIRAACQTAGAVYPEDEQNPEDWAPKPEDRLMGLRIEVREDCGTPHIERPKPFGQLS